MSESEGASEGVSEGVCDCLRAHASNALMLLHGKLTSFLLPLSRVDRCCVVSCASGG